MGQELAFGTYSARQSCVHRMNTQVKIILTCAFSIGVFFIESWMGLALVTVATTAAYFAARIRVLQALHGLIPIVFIVIFIVAAHMFSGGLREGVTGEWILFEGFGITLHGLSRGLFFATRIVLLVLFCSLLTFTSSTTALTEAITALLGVLRHLRVPVDDIAMTISIAVRFIPTTAEEAYAIVDARKARCARFGMGGLFARIKAWMPVIIPLVVRLFVRADDLARAMDARGWRAAKRTRWHDAHPHAGDYVVLALGLVLISALCILF